MLTLDYSITSLEERLTLVNQIVESDSNIKPEYLANYLIMCMEKEERKQKKILTDNRVATIEKRETSFEGLVEKLENGENGLYHMERSDKNMLLSPKSPITKQDYEDYAELRQIKEAIDFLKGLPDRGGRNNYFIKKATIELYKDLYAAKKALKPPVMPSATIAAKFPARLEGISFSDPDVISALLCNYSILKQESWGKFESDLWCIMIDFDALLDKALADNEYFETIAILKIDGKTNAEIQETLRLKLGISPTPEYISTLWRNRIPKHIADYAAKDHLMWYWTNIRKAQWKKCSRCGEIKLASTLFFNKNKTSKDGFYSLCKECRSVKGQKKVKDAE